MMFPLKPRLMGDFLLPRLITGGRFFFWVVKHSNQSHAQWWSLWDKDNQLGIQNWDKLCYSVIFVFFFTGLLSHHAEKHMCLCTSECPVQIADGHGCDDLIDENLSMSGLNRRVDRNLCMYRAHRFWHCRCVKLRAGEEAAKISTWDVDTWWFTPGILG